jgi:hypothetical protein
MNKNVVGFILGLGLGYRGLSLLVHLGYLLLAIACFCAGKWL